MRPRGAGSIYFRARDNRWVVAISLGGGKRKHYLARTEEEAHARLGEITPEAPRRQRDNNYRARAAAIADRVLARAEAMGWDRVTTARVLAASMTRRRILHDIVGPCAYCGDEFADTVDHVIPYAAGGTDDPENIVSSCWPCNAKKGRRTAAEALGGVASEGRS